MTAVEEPLVSESRPELFHYTTLKALEGILESGTLWATHAKHLNDSSEFDLMWDKITPVLTDYLHQAALSDPSRFHEHQDTIDGYGGLEGVSAHDADGLVRTMKDLIFDLTPPFVACFTAHKDSYDRRNGLLSQWRGYGDDGVAVVFDTKKLAELLKRECDRFHYLSCSLLSAVYYAREFNLTGSFPRLFDALKSVSHVIVDGFRNSGLSLEAFEELSIELLPTVGRLKHWGFREEKECRIIVGVSDRRQEDMVESSLDHGEFKEVCFRPGGCGSIPYIKLFEGIGDLPISKILVGPSKNQEANAGMVEAMLQRLAPGRSIALEKSEIPFVGTA